MSLSIGIDIGGTKVFGGVVTSEGDIIASARRDTPAEGGLTLARTIAEVAQELIAAHPVTSVGISMAGFISADRKTIYSSPNIKNCEGLNLESELIKLVDAKIVIENDANCAAWAEYIFGAGKNCDDMVMLTVGTGIGGGIVIDGKIHRGHFGIGAEMGHMRVLPDGLLCGCGQKGCYEVYASGSALVRYVKEALTSDPARSKAFRGDLSRLQGSDITRAAQAGDSLAREAFEKVGSWLGQGIASVNAILDPEIVVIGGGVSEAGELLLTPTRRAFEEAMPSSQLRPLARIVPSRFSNNAGVIGAADLARH